MNKIKVNSIMLEELLCEPLDFLSSITGWTIIMHENKKGFLTKRKFEIFNGESQVIVETKTWNDNVSIRDSYAIQGIGENLSATYELKLA